MAGPAVVVHRGLVDMVVVPRARKTADGRAAAKLHVGQGHGQGAGPRREIIGPPTQPTPGAPIHRALGSMVAAPLAPERWWF